MKMQTPEDKRRAEAADHDRWVRSLSDHAVLAAARDLGQPSRKLAAEWMERNWTMGRLAALGREVWRRGLNRKTPTPSR